MVLEFEIRWIAAGMSGINIVTHLLTNIVTQPAQDGASRAGTALGHLSSQSCTQSWDLNAPLLQAGEKRGKQTITV